MLVNWHICIFWHEQPSEMCKYTRMSNLSVQTAYISDHSEHIRTLLYSGWIWTFWIHENIFQFQCIYWIWTHENFLYFRWIWAFWTHKIFPYFRHIRPYQRCISSDIHRLPVFLTHFAILEKSPVIPEKFPVFYIGSTNGEIYRRISSDILYRFVQPNYINT